jgi:hypothetical protein
MDHPFASELSQTKFPINNVLDGRPIHREIACYYSSIHEGKPLQKALKSQAQRKQKSSRQFFVAVEKIAGFESPEPILESGQ